MSPPLRVTCPTARDIPPAYQLRAWADSRPVVLQFPSAALPDPGAKSSVVARLAAALPEFRVSDNGGDHAHELVTVTCPV